jgi:hypothetical protein
MMSPLTMLGVFRIDTNLFVQHFSAPLRLSPVGKVSNS